MWFSLLRRSYVFTERLFPLVHSILTGNAIARGVVIRLNWSAIPNEFGSNEFLQDLFFEMGIY